MPTTVAEKPHAGTRGLPFMKRTTGCAFTRREKSARWASVRGIAAFLGTNRRGPQLCSSSTVAADLLIQSLRMAVSAGSGTMGELIAAKDWSKTAIGPSGEWSPTLRTVLRTMLGSRYAMWMGWG